LCVFGVGNPKRYGYIFWCSWCMALIVWKIPKNMDLCVCMLWMLETSFLLNGNCCLQLKTSCKNQLKIPYFLLVQGEKVYCFEVVCKGCHCSMIEEYNLFFLYWFWFNFHYFLVVAPLKWKFKCKCHYNVHYLVFLGLKRFLVCFS